MKAKRALALAALIVACAAAAFASGKADAASADAQGTSNPAMAGGPPPGSPPGPPPGQGGAIPSGTVDHGTYAAKADSDIDGGTFSSTGDAENALRVEGGVRVTLDNLVVRKTAGAAGAGDSSNFYGSNAGILVMDGSEAVIDDADVRTAADGANGIYSYGDGTSVTVNNASIKTSNRGSGGVMVAGGGSMTVNDSDIETQGGSSAALRTDRGGGTLTVDGGSYVSHGDGSPAVYSTAAVTVSNAALVSTTSEAIVVEGMNSVSLENCDVTGNMRKDNVENLQNVMIYQSMSGDAETGKSSFSMTGGTLVSNNGDMFYVTNTSCDIRLEGVGLTLSNDTLLRVVGNDARNGWGTAGQNGGQCEMTAVDQSLRGNVVVDGISSLALSLTEGTDFTGTVNAEGSDGTVSVHVDSSSTWTMTGDAYVTGLTGAVENIHAQGHTLYLNGKAVDNLG